MGAIASQVNSLTIVYSMVYSGADQRKHKSSASLAFVRGIHRWPANSPQKWTVTRKMSPFDDVITKYMLFHRIAKTWEIITDSFSKILSLPNNRFYGYKLTLKQILYDNLITEINATPQENDATSWQSIFTYKLFILLMSVLLIQYVIYSFPKWLWWLQWHTIGLVWPFFIFHLGPLANWFLLNHVCNCDLIVINVFELSDKPFMYLYPAGYRRPPYWTLFMVL